MQIDTTPTISYLVKFGNTFVLFESEESFRNFIETAVIRNKDITKFEVRIITGYSVKQQTEKVGSGLRSFPPNTIIVK